MSATKKKNRPIRVFCLEDCYIHEKLWQAGNSFLYYGPAEDLKVPGSPIVAADSPEALKAAAAMEQSTKAEALPWVHGTGSKVGVHPALVGYDDDEFDD